jgi:membrane-bound metal-dependent hydrolase YbcI (DUF457 family)
MFIGHFGVAFAAKKLAPRTNVAVAILAGEFVDVVWPILVLLGVEKLRIVPGMTVVTPLDFVSYPWTHSLLMSFVWGILFSGVFYAICRDGRAATVLAAVVISHWFLDYLTHRPDLQLAPGLPARYGLGLWNSRLWTYIVELAIFFGGVAIYMRCTRALDGKGRWGFPGYVAFLLVLYIVNLQGPPPPAINVAMVISEFGTILLFAWAWWFDQHREVTV